ncbi:MAG: hypothetical protein LIP77_07485 [Planctomycetes bacterium]|nr:hypothetical protein [Planctomycetota bacterium]
MSTSAEQGGIGGFGKNWTDKLRLLDAIDAMREPAPHLAAAAGADASVPISVEVLQEKLRVYEQTCAMLEQEVQTLEQQTLAALAEAGRLRRELDRTEAEKKRNVGFLDYAEKDSIRQIIAESENERRLLLDALENSEAELARMVKTLDMVARKLQVA